MDINEKVAFIKGLMEGMKFSAESNEGILISKIVDLLGDMADEIKALGESVDTHEDYLDELDHDLGEVEEYVYDDDYDDECCCDDDDCDCCDDCFDDDDDDEYDEDDEDEDDLYEVECPHCHDKIYIDESMLDKKIECPNCNKIIVDEECEEDE